MFNWNTEIWVRKKFSGDFLHFLHVETNWYWVKRKESDPWVFLSLLDHQIRRYQWCKYGN